MRFVLSNHRFRSIVMVVLMIVPAACTGDTANRNGQPAGISPKEMADALYAGHGVGPHRLCAPRESIVCKDQEGVVLASEHWKDDKALPLPAQMFRMGAELVAAKTDRFSYSLLSKWPVNKQNAPRTEVEIAGLDQVVKDPTKPFYGRESLGGVEYFTAVYPDVAVSQACVTCHNGHKDSPRNDFELGKTMGGVVIRIRLG